MSSTAAAGGLRPARPDQHYEPPAGGQAIPGQRGVVRARQVIVFGTGPNSGLFVYSPTPGLGNLIASITADGTTTDPYGNTVLSGISEYHEVTPSFFTAVQLDRGEIVFYDAGAQPGPWTALYTMNAAPAFGIQDNSSSNTIAMTQPGVSGPALVVNGASQLSGSAVINGNALATALAVTAGALQLGLSVVGGIHADGLVTTGGTADQVVLNGNVNNQVIAAISNALGNGGKSLVQLTTGGTPSTDRALGIQATADTNERIRIDTAPVIHFGSGTASPDCAFFRGGTGFLASDYIAYANNAGTVEAWQIPTFSNSWANAASGPNLQYRRVAAPYNSIQWVGRLTVPLGIVVNSQSLVTTSPTSPYHPANAQSLFGWDITANVPVRFQIGTGGALSYQQGAIGTGDTVEIPPQLVSLDA